MHRQLPLPGTALVHRIATIASRFAGSPSGKALLRFGEIVTSVGGALAMVVILIHRGDGPSIAGIGRTMWFWLLLGAYLVMQPLCDLLAFRAIWPLSWRALPVLFRKAAINEVVLGYLGDLHLYGWAKRYPQTSEAAFVSIKDSAIISALVGNLVTIAMTVVAWPRLGSLDLGSARLPLEISFALVLGPSFVVSMLRTRVFSSTREALARIALFHALRVIGVILVICLLWRSAIPGVALSSLLLLGVGRQLLTRLPLAPNKDLIFAGLVSLLAVPGSLVSAGIAGVATTIVIAQAAVGVVLMIAGMVVRTWPIAAKPHHGIF